MTRSELRAALALDAVEARTLHVLAGTLPFVEVDARRWGLVDRDVPGGAKAFEAAIAALERAACAMSQDAVAVIASLLAPHSSWTPEMAGSAYRVLKVRRAAFAAERTGVRAHGSP